MSDPYIDEKEYLTIISSSIKLEYIPVKTMTLELIL